MSRLSLRISPVQGICNGGAGGNRTPVHQALNVRDTTIPTFSLTQGDRRVSWPSVARWPANRLSESSSVFPDASSLFRCHPPLLVPGCGGSAPCAISGHDVSSQPNKSGGESELLVGNSVCAPFYESEQLGSHARKMNLTSKPVSPVVWVSSDNLAALTRNGPARFRTPGTQRPRRTRGCSEMRAGNRVACRCWGLCLTRCTDCWPQWPPLGLVPNRTASPNGLSQIEWMFIEFATGPSQNRT